MQDNREIIGGQELVNQFAEAFQKQVEQKFPDFKENQEQPTEVKIGPLEQGETIEERRINNLQKVGVNPYKPHVIIHFSAVHKHKSIWRAMRRGHVSVNGEEFPKKPFNNRANTSSRPGIHSRVENQMKINIYGEYRKIAERG